MLTTREFIDCYGKFGVRAVYIMTTDLLDHCGDNYDFELDEIEERRLALVTEIMAATVREKFGADVRWYSDEMPSWGWQDLQAREVFDHGVPVMKVFEMRFNIPGSNFPMVARLKVRSAICEPHRIFAMTFEGARAV